MEEMTCYIIARHDSEILRYKFNMNIPDLFEENSKNTIEGNKI